MFQDRILQLGREDVSTAKFMVSSFLKATKETLMHSYTVAEIAYEFAKLDGNLGKPEDLWLAGVLHDYGKIAIRQNLLEKVETLTPDEMAEVRNHSTLGGRALQNMFASNYVFEAALFHHERFDGLGYPDKLKGTHIPLQARVISIIDSYEAMRSPRSYKNPMPEDDALAELEAGAGKIYDPEIIKAFLNYRNVIDKAYIRSHSRVLSNMVH